MIAIVVLDDPTFGSGPGTVLEVSDEPIREILSRYTRHDGARNERLRFWIAPEGCCKEGDRVEAARLVPGTGRWEGNLR